MSNTIKINSRPLERIILAKLLNGTEQLELQKKLVQYIENLSQHTSVNDYYKLVVDEIIIGVESIIEDWKAKLTADSDLTPFESDLQVYNYLYKCVLKIYRTMQLEAVCNSVNSNKFLTEFKDDIVIVEGVGPVLKSANPDVKFTKRDTVKKPKRLNLAQITLLEAKLKNAIIGQDQAIDKIIEFIKLKEVGLESYFSMLLIGKTGTGKTLISKKLAEYYTNNKLITIDCSVATSNDEKTALLGSPPGYIGHTGTSFLESKAKESNSWIFLLDELEKANATTLDNLLNFIDTGKIIDSNRKELDFTESIFIMTSNHGLNYEAGTVHKVGFNSETTKQSKEDLIKELNSKFKREFLNRIDNITVVNDLTELDIKKIAKLELSKYPIKISDDLVSYVSTNGYSAEYGARNLKRFIKSNIGLPIADYLLNTKSKAKMLNGSVVGKTFIVSNN